MAYQDFIWENQVINGKKIKSVRVRIFEASENIKAQRWANEKAYTDGEFHTSKQIGDFTILVLTSAPTQMGNARTPKEKTNKFLKLRVFITPNFKMKNFKNMFDKFSANNEEVLYEYVEKALQQYNSCKN